MLTHPPKLLNPESQDEAARGISWGEGALGALAPQVTKGAPKEREKRKKEKKKERKRKKKNGKKETKREKIGKLT